MRITYKQLALLISQMPSEAQALDVAIVNNREAQVCFLEGVLKVDINSGPVIDILGLDTPVLSINMDENPKQIY